MWTWRHWLIGRAECCGKWGNARRQMPHPQLKPRRELRRKRRWEFSLLVHLQRNGFYTVRSFQPTHEHQTLTAARSFTCYYEKSTVMIRYDTRCCLSCAQKLTWVNLIYRTEPKLKKWKREKLKIETLGEFMETVLKKKRLWRDRFVEKEGFTPGVKEWGSDGWWQGETLENNLPSNSLTGLTVEFERIRASPTPEDLSIPSCESRLPTGHHHTWQAVTT